MTRAQIYFFFLLFCVISFSLPACGPKAGAGEMADGLCSCMRPMADAIRDMEKMTSEGGAQTNLDTLQRAMSDIEAVRAGVDSCIDQLEARFGDELERAEEQIRREMAERCPEVVQVMREGEER